MEWQAVLPWALAMAGGVAAVYERIVARGVWRNVAEGRGAQIADLERQVEQLKSDQIAMSARLDVLSSDFAFTIACKVAEILEVD